MGDGVADQLQALAEVAALLDENGVDIVDVDPRSPRTNTNGEQMRADVTIVATDLNEVGSTDGESEKGVKVDDLARENIAELADRIDDLRDDRDRLLERVDELTTELAKKDGGAEREDRSSTDEVLEAREAVQEETDAESEPEPEDDQEESGDVEDDADDQADDEPEEGIACPVDGCDYVAETGQQLGGHKAQKHTGDSERSGQTVAEKAIAALEDADEPLTADEVADRVDARRSSVGATLSKLASDGEVKARPDPEASHRNLYRTVDDEIDDEPDDTEADSTTESASIEDVEREQKVSSGKWCGWCGEHFDDEDDVHEHSQWEHPDSEERILDGAPHVQCDDCGRHYYRDTEYSNHLKFSATCIQLPDHVTEEEFEEIVDEASTVYEVSRELRMQREMTKRLLKKYGLKVTGEQPTVEFDGDESRERPDWLARSPEEMVAESSADVSLDRLLTVVAESDGPSDVYQRLAEVDARALRDLLWQLGLRTAEGSLHDDVDERVADIREWVGLDRELAVADGGEDGER